MDRPSAPKIRRSGRYYACPYCSFSADKRVSLNRHMRVHVGLPLLATHPVSPPPPPPPPSQLPHPQHHQLQQHNPFEGTDGDLVATAPGNADRFCTECKIQFTSLKTFQVHKQHYCQSRKPQVSAPVPPPPLTSSPPPPPTQTQAEKSLAMGAASDSDRSSAAGGPMTILVLPTHPPIVVPLCILQSARLLTADQPMPLNSVIVSPHGDVQLPPPPPTPSSSSAVAAEKRSQEPIKTVVAEKRKLQETTTAPAPLPPPPPPPVAAKNKRRDDEALDLSSKISDHEDSQPEDASGPPQPKTKSGSIRVREETQQQSSPISVLVAPSAAAAAAAAALPFLPPKVFAELEALGMCLGVPSAHDMQANPAQWLAMLESAVLQASNSDRSLGINSSSSSASNPALLLTALLQQQQQLQQQQSNNNKQQPPPQPQQQAAELAAVQQQRPGSAIPCEECNISFRRMESYLVHKQYYCAARHQPQQQPQGTTASTPAAAAASTTKEPESNGTPIDSDTSLSVTPPANPPPPPTAAAASVREPSVIQQRAKMACPLCGIEFESAVTLQAHRNFYCPKRDKAEPTATVSPNNNNGTPCLSYLSFLFIFIIKMYLLLFTVVASGGGPPTTVAGGSQQQQQQMGWKCPCCDTVSATAAAAQKHVETHSNVRAFRCSVCGYRGNTLRGMRTHVRIHFDRRNADLCEDNYISCIMSGATGLSPDFTNLPAAAAAAAAAGMMPSSPPDMDQILKSLGIPADVCAKVLSSAAAAAASAQNQGRPSSEEAAASAARAAGAAGASSLAGLQFLQLAQRMANHSPGPTTGAGCRSDKLFLCDLCCYSSSYRGNVIRHSKLVHGREISDVAVVSSNFLQQAVTGGKPMPPSASDAAHVKLLLSAAAEQQQQQQQHSPGSTPLANPVSAAAAAAAVVAARTPISTSSSPTSGPMDESIQVKIDPEDLLLGMASHHHQLQLLQQQQQHRSIGTGSNHSSQSGHSPLASELTSGGAQSAAATDPFRKHCKSCNITFTYMNTFLAHKKYYCSSHAPLGGGDQDHTGVESGGQEEEDEDDVDDDIDQRGNGSGGVVDDDMDSDPIHSPPPRPAHHSEATLT